MTPQSKLGLQDWMKFQNRKYQPKPCFKKIFLQEPLCRFITKLKNNNMYEDMLQVTTIFKGIFLMQNMLSNCNVENFRI